MFQMVIHKGASKELKVMDEERQGMGVHSLLIIRHGVSLWVTREAKLMQ